MCEKIYDSKFSDLDAVTAYSLWQLRSRVFVVGQQLNVLDLDGRDLEPTTWHVWAAVDGRPVSYLRVLEDAEGRAVIGRVATHPDHRGRGIGGRVLKHALEVCAGREVTMHAQAYLREWYERFGFVAEGNEFQEAGIPHIFMRRAAEMGEA